MSRIRCQKCGAGRGALEPIIEHFANGPTLQTVRCIMCGERRSREASRYEQIAKTKTRLARSGRVCALVGCDNELANNNHLGLCRDHGKALTSWLHSKRRKPAPYLQTADGWIPNPEREVNHAHV